MASGGDRSSDVENLPLEKAKSPVWRFFGFPARGGKFIEPDKKKRTSVHCKMCKQELSYKGNTTNMLVHFQYNHRREYNDEKYSCMENLYFSGNTMKHSFLFLQNLQKSTFAFPLLQYHRREHLVQQGMLSTRNEHAYFPRMLICSFSFHKTLTE